MIGELFFALLRLAIYFFIFYFIYKVVAGVLRALRGDDQRKSPEQPQQDTPPRKTVQSYGDVADAKFKDIPPGEPH